MPANGQPKLFHTFRPPNPTGALPWWLPILLGFLTAAGPIATDIYLPAFPIMVKDLHTDLAGVQQTLSIWFIGLAIGQLTVGPMADRFGRRAPLIIGNLIFAFGSAVCAAAPDIYTFFGGRFVASLGASASLVIPTACVRDLVPDVRAGARMMSRLVMVMGVVPILAPMLGGVAVTFVSWRVIFWASTGYGVLCTLLVIRLLPETLAPDLRSRLSPISLVTRYVGLLKDRGFLSHALIVGFSTFMSFSYLTAASPVFINGFGFTPLHFSMLFGLFAIFMIGASQLNGMLVNHFSPERLLAAAVMLAAGGSLALLGVSLWVSGHMPLPPGISLEAVVTIGTMIVALGATGIIYPNAMMGALADHAKVAGAASALAGTMQYVFGALTGGLIGILSAQVFPREGSPMPMTIGMLLGALMMVATLPLRPRGK
ncbi:multidrug ABC transporter [Acetobacter estunensis NRIC 0472]|uniref:Bcr/CflA family efflux transporter n=1 Tax=Acetobacter estunensis TaxID=104097 RepID=A0A967B383_9PROT|nr:multidrug effflux MFS transporter [Acetobacter estunensis]NHO52409.1 Bcr/CflA family efflux MFS transporter [Acetobacter estunensis]GBQ25911.1 multidrug ABC transporter [Acetobacter estunensis NRIC 0472]